MSAEEYHENPYFRRFAELLLRFWPIAVLLTVAITVVFAHQAATRLRFDSSTEYFSSGDAELDRLLEEYRDDFGRDDLYVVVVEGDVFTMPFLQRLNTLHRELEQLDVPLSAAVPTPAPAPADDFGFAEFGDEGWGTVAGATLVEDVTSLIDVRQTVADGGSIRIRGLLEEMPTEAELPDVRRRALSDPAVVGHVVGAKGRHAALMVRTRLLSETDSSAVSAAIEAVAARHVADGFRPTVTGLPTLNAHLNRIVEADSAVLMVVAMITMAFVLAWLFRHPVAVFGPLLVVGLGVIWTIGSMAATGTPVTLLTTLVPAFIVCVGIGDAIHIQSVYRDIRVQGVDNREAVIRAVASTGWPIVLTAITTAAGLVSFKATSTVAIQEMGLFGAFGTIAALVNSFVFLPLALYFKGGAFAGASSTTAEPDLLDRFIRGTTQASAEPSGRRFVLALFAGITALGIVGLSRVQVYHNPLVWFGEDSPVTQNIRRMDENVGGTATVNLVIDAGDRGMKDLDLLRSLERLEQHIRDYRDPRTGEPIVTGTISLLDVAREMNRALHDGAAEFYRLPDDQQSLSDAMLLFENAGPAELQKLVTADLRRSHMTIRLHWMDATFYGPFAEYLDEGIARHVGDRAQVRPTGTAFHLLTVVDSLIADLIKSFGVALITVTITMILLLRDVRLGLLSMLPNQFPVLAILGFMGLTGITLDLSNLLIASIVTGIAVDDTIHFLHHWQNRFRATGDADDAIRHAVVHTGRAMVSTSAILVLGFSVYLASQLVSIQRFGTLSGFTIVVAMLAELLLAPALLRAAYGRFVVRSGGRHVAAA